MRLGVAEDDRVRVTTRAVPHPSLHLRFGFRFETEHGSSRSPVTADSDSVGVGDLAAGAGLLVHETLELGRYRAPGSSPGW